MRSQTDFFKDLLTILTFRQKFVSLFKKQKIFSREKIFEEIVIKINADISKIGRDLPKNEIS